MERVDGAILAAGRLAGAASPDDSLKATITVGNRTLLDATVKALRHTPAVDRIVAVAPSALFSANPAVDGWVEERATGEENVMAALEAARTNRVIVTASDMPFVEAAHIEQFLALVPGDADFAYPVFTREEFLAAFPASRTKFAPVGGHSWTGGSLCVLNRELARKNGALIRRGFAARKSQLALASLLGMNIIVRFATGTLKLADVERRIADLTGGKAVAIIGAHPALAMDCDSSADLTYVRAQR